MHETELATRTRSEKSRYRLIEAARDVLMEHAGKAEIGEIAGRAGVSVGLAYHHFGSKDGLFSAVVQDFYDRYSAIANARYVGESWADREIQRTQATVFFLVREPFTATLFGPLGRSSVVVEAEAVCMANLVELGARNIAHGQADGDLPRGADVKMAAAFVLGGMRQAVTLALLVNPQPDPIQLARHVWILISRSLGLIPESYS